MPTRSSVAETRAFDSWLNYQQALVRRVATLSPDQLQRRLLPARRTPGEIVEHIVFGRSLHLTRILGDRATSLADLLRWESPADTPRTAAELVHGLERTWRVIEDALMSGAAETPLDAEPASVARQIWGLLDHDLPHAGQLSLLLRADGLPGVDI
jgi:hypothetical protein